MPSLLNRHCTEEKDRERCTQPCYPKPTQVTQLIKGTIINADLQDKTFGARNLLL